MELLPPSTFPWMRGMERPPNSGVGVVGLGQRYSGMASRRLIPRGTDTHGLLSRPPASSSRTRCLPDAVSRLATMQPAVPAPTMM